jgi:hypothetical protein
MTTPGNGASGSSNSSTPRQRLVAAVAIGLVTILTLVGSEAGYRIYLRYKLEKDVAAKQKPLDDATFGANGVAPWVFNRDLGFEFNQIPWRSVVISNRAFAGCGVSPPANPLRQLRP